jgi:hypothetical protein
MIELLPVCRKEKYYTSCVLPQIICGENFERLSKFLEYIGASDAYLYETYDLSNILFYTEYSLKESAYWDLSNLKTKDTPDLLFLIKNKSGTTFLLVVIEGKMFHRVNARDLKFQLDSQKPIIESIINHSPINIEKVIHVGLIKNTPKDIDLFQGYKTITWGDVWKLYESIIPQNYFLQILYEAINNPQYEQRIKFLGSNSSPKNKNYRDTSSFKEIIKLCKEKGASLQVGFIGGVNKLKNSTIRDLENRMFKWDNIVNPIGKKTKSNWIIGTEFLKTISDKL